MTRADGAGAAAPQPLGEAPSARHARVTAWTIWVICIAQLIVSLDGNVVLIAAPTIQRGLGFPVTGLQWLFTGYALTYGSLLLTGGRAGDLLGHRRAFLWALGFFGATSLAGGLAPSPVVLIAARVLQGAGAAILAPAALALISTTFPEGPERHRAFGIFQGLSAMGATVGIVVGGLLTQAFGWRAVFLINPPVIAALLLWGRAHLPPGAPGQRERLDVAGSALAAGTLATCIYALSRAQSHGLANPVVAASLLLAVVLGAAFILVELRHPQPMLDLRLLADPARRTSLLAGLLLGGVISSNAYDLILYLQHVLGYSPLLTGLAATPGTVAGIVLSVYLTRPLIGRLGPRRALIAGLAVAGVGQYWLSHLSGNYLLVVLPGYLLTFAGASLARPAVSVRVTAGVSARQQGQAGGLVVASAQAGSASLLALLVILAQGRTAATGSPLDGYRFAYQLAVGLIAIAIAVVLAQGVRRRRDAVAERPSASL